MTKVPSGETLCHPCHECGEEHYDVEGKIRRLGYFRLCNTCFKKAKAKLGLRKVGRGIWTASVRE